MRQYLKGLYIEFGFSFAGLCAKAQEDIVHMKNDLFLKNFEQKKEFLKLDQN